MVPKFRIFEKKFRNFFEIFSPLQNGLMMRPFFDFLGELLAPLLDIIYSSDEKDKVVPLLSRFVDLKVFLG